MRRVNFDLLASALTIVIADEIIVPEIEQCFRLDFFVEKVTLKIKHQIYNSMSERYIVR